MNFFKNKTLPTIGLLMLFAVFSVAMNDGIDLIDGAALNATSEQPDTTIYNITEVPAVFPGGDFARINYLFENLDYPEEALENGIQGTVYVSFIVETDGSITNVNIMRGIGGGCDEEVIRMVSNMPNWAPGRIKGKPVRSIFRMPVKFALRDFEELEQLKLAQDEQPAFDVTRDAVLFVNGQKQDYNLLEFDKKYSLDDVETIDFLLDGKGMENYGYPNVVVITTKR